MDALDSPGTPSCVSSTAAAGAAAAAEDTSTAATHATSSGGGRCWPVAAILVAAAIVAGSFIAFTVLRTQYDAQIAAALSKKYWDEALILLCGIFSWWWLHDQYTPLTDAERRDEAMMRRSPTKKRPAVKAMSSSKFKVTTGFICCVLVLGSVLLLEMMVKVHVLDLRVHDRDGDGDVDVAELTHYLHGSCVQNGVCAVKDAWIKAYPEAASLSDAGIADEIVKAFDTDKDGDLDGADLARANAKLNALTTTDVDILAHDENNDGGVDVAELTASIVKHCGEMTNTADGQKLCLKQLWATQHPEHALLGDAAVAKAIVAAFDADGDGDIDGDELHRANTALKA